MTKSLFIHGLLNKDAKTVASYIATWETTKVGKITSCMVKGLCSKDDKVNKAIDDRRKQLYRNFKNCPEVLQAHFIRMLCHHLNISVGKMKSIGELEDLGKTMEQGAIRVQKQIAPKEFKGRTFDDLMKYDLKKIFKKASDNFNKKGEKEQKKIVNNVMRVIAQMDEEQKIALRSSLKIDRITKSAVSKMITTGALAVAFASLVNTAGFSAYIVGVKMLAALTGIVGVTLPFSAYCTLTSFIAAFANPFLTFPIIIGVGMIASKRVNKRIRDTLLPVLLTFTCIEIQNDSLRSRDKKVELLLQKLREDIYERYKSIRKN